MSAGIILPVAKSLYLCEGYIGYPKNGLTDLMNIFNALRPKSYPHVHRDFVVYSRLSGGLGAIQFYVEVREAATGQLIHVSNTFTLHFPDRDQTVEMALTFNAVPFAHPGVCTVELYLENQWECDCTLQLL
jgi:hypothetical protein